MLIKLKVTPGSKKDKITARSADHFDIFVKAKAEDNKANKSALELLSEYLGVSVKDIRIIKGHTSPSKIVDVFNMI